MPGLLEILIIVGLALLLFGYSRAPMLGKSLGVGISEFRRAFKKAAGLPDSSLDKKDEKK